MELIAGKRKTTRSKSKPKSVRKPRAKRAGSIYDGYSDVVAGKRKSKKKASKKTSKRMSKKKAGEVQYLDSYVVAGCDDHYLAGKSKHSKKLSKKTSKKMSKKHSMKKGSGTFEDVMNGIKTVAQTAAPIVELAMQVAPLFAAGKSKSEVKAVVMKQLKKKPNFNAKQKLLIAKRKKASGIFGDIGSELGNQLDGIVEPLAVKLMGGATNRPVQVLNAMQQRKLSQRQLKLAEMDFRNRLDNEIVGRNASRKDKAVMDWLKARRTELSNIKSLAKALYGKQEDEFVRGQIAQISTKV